MVPDPVDPELVEAEDASEGLTVLTAWTACLGLAAAILFVGFPQIDLWVAGLFYSGDGGFVLARSEPAELIRRLFWFLFWIAAWSAIFGLLASAFTRERLFGLAYPKWLFLVLSLIIGPGLIANPVLKDGWGRARPAEVTAFGGDMQFTPAMVRTDQCAHNCSFVGGETAGIYGLFLSLALIQPRRRRRLIAVAIAGGTLLGLIRMGQGRHFLSDILFSGIIVMAVALAIYWLIMVRFGRVFAHGGPFHRFWIGLGDGVKALPGRLAKAAARGSR